MTEEEMKAKIAELENEKAALKTKNSELIDREKTARSKAEEAEAAREEAAEKAERDAKDVEALEKRLTAKFQKDIDALTKQRDELTVDLRTVRVDNEITKALAEGKVLDHQIEPLTYMFKGKAAYEDGKATIDGKGIGEYIGEYLGSAMGAHFVRAANNSGGGSTGNSSTTVPTNHGYTKDNFSSREGEFLALAKSNPAEAKAIALSVGRTDLAADL